jgi:hypothetical protein
VTDLAKKLKVEPATVRVQLRNAGIKRAGRSYGWNTEADLSKTANQLRKAA